MVAARVGFAHAREGMPTRGSFAFSQNNKRTGFFTDTINLLEPKLQRELEKDIDAIITVEFFDAVERRFQKITEAA